MGSPRMRVVALVLGAGLLLWLATMRDGGPAPRTEGEPDVAAATGQASDPAQRARPTDGPAAQPAAVEPPVPDLDDAPRPRNQVELELKATERGLARVAQNLELIETKAREAEEAGNTAQAELMRKRIAGLKERKAALERERAEFAAKVETSDQ